MLDRRETARGLRQVTDAQHLVLAVFWDRLTLSDDDNQFLESRRSRIVAAIADFKEAIDALTLAHIREKGV